MAGEGVGQTQLSFIHLKFFLLDEGGEMRTDASEEFKDHFVSCALHSQGGRYHSGQVFVLHRQGVTFFLFDVSC